MIRLALLALLVGALSGGAGSWRIMQDRVQTRDAVIAGLRNDVAERDQNNAALRESRDTVNERMRSLIADNNARVDAEVERRKRIAAERDKSREALRIALDAIRTESETDETFAAWLAQPVPGAAWDRLRDAAE